MVRTQIASFIETYKIDLTELAQPDISSYKVCLILSCFSLYTHRNCHQTFNQFFARKLKPGARTPAWPNDPSIVVSMADCRLTVWPNWDMSRRIWFVPSLKLSTYFRALFFSYIHTHIQGERQELHAPTSPRFTQTSTILRSRTHTRHPPTRSTRLPPFPRTHLRHAYLSKALLRGLLHRQPTSRQRAPRRAHSEHAHGRCASDARG